MTLRRILLYGLCALLALAPLPFGSVERGASVRMGGACFLLGVIWIAWRCRSGLSPVPWREPVLAAGLLVAALGFVQIAPWPHGALTTLSPQAASLRAAYEPPSSAGDSGWRPISLDPDATRFATFKWLAYVVAALITIDLASRSDERRTLVVGLTASGGFQAIYGLTEFLSGRQHILGYAKKYYTDVATGTFINRNHYAGYLAMTLPLALAMLAGAVGRLHVRSRSSIAERIGGASGRDLFVAGLLLLLALVMATALVCSRSRMGIASAVLAMAGASLLPAVNRRGRTFAITALLVTAATLLLFAQGGAGTPLMERFAHTVSEFQGQFGRREIWRQALGMTRSFPILGAGLGAFDSVFPAFRTGGSGFSFAHAHNDYIEIASETGIIGCLVVLAALAVVLARHVSWKTGRADFGAVGWASCAGILAIGVHSLTDFNLEIPSNALTLAILAGLAIAWRRPPVPMLAAGSAGSTRAGAGWVSVWGPAAIMVGVVAWLTMPVKRPEATFRAAARLERDVMADLQALDQASAVGMTPSALAVSYIEKRLDEAKRLQIEGLRRLPASSTGHLGLARIELARCVTTSFSGPIREGCTDSAMREFRSAVELAPMNARLHAQAARILITGWPLISAEQRPHGRSIVDRAVAMNPDDHDLADARVAMQLL